MNVKHYVEVTKVFSNEGSPLVCRYLKMKEFEPNDSLCQTMHFCFCLYASNKGYSSGANARVAVEEFLKFRVWFNKLNPDALQIRELSDINVEILRVYLKFLQKRNIRIKAILSLRNMLHYLLTMVEGFPSILFPKLPKEKFNSYEPLDDGAIDQLDKALKQHIDKLYEKLRFRQQVDEAIPYTYEEIMETCFPSGSKRNVYEWYRYALENYSSPKLVKVVGKIKALPNLDSDFQLCLEKADPNSAFLELYEKESSKYLNEVPYNPFEFAGMRRWKPNYVRVLKTFHVHNYPFKLPLEATRQYNYENTRNIEECKDVIALIYHRLTRAKHVPKRLERTGIPVIGIDEVLNLYYPNQIDMAAIVIMLQFQAGWNKETVIALDQNDFEHSLSGMIDETQRLISSEKNRGQNSHLPFSKPKTMLAVSDMRDKYSIYRVIELAKNLSQPLAELEGDESEALNRKINKLFICTTDHGDWYKKTRFSTMGNTKTSTRGVKDFLKTYEIFHTGERLTKSGQVVNHLRPTWVYLKRKTEPLSLVQAAAGHASPVTTDVHYDSSPQSKKTRKDRLSSELNKIFDKLKSRKLEGLLPNESLDKATSKTIAIFSIPGHNRELWGCNDQTNPTWRNHSTYISRGEKCFYLNKCIGCKQLRLFNDSLPYVLERLEYIEESMRQMPAIEFTPLFGSEYDSLKWIVDNWGDDEEIKIANRFLKKNRPLLPKDIASLMPLMKALSESTADDTFWGPKK